MKPCTDEREQKKETEISALMQQIHACGQEILDEFVRICEENQFRYYLCFGTLIGAVRHKGPIPWDDDVDVVMPRADYDAFKELMLARPEGELYHIQCYENDPDYWAFFSRLDKRGTIYCTQQALDEGRRYTEMWIDVFPLDNAPETGKFRFQCICMRMKWLRRMIVNKLKKNTDRMSFQGKLLHFILKPVSCAWLRSRVDKTISKWNRKKSRDCIIWGAPKYLTIPKTWFEPAQKMMYTGKYYFVPCKWDKLLRKMYGDYMQLPPEEERVGHLPIKIKL